ncbi:hypothetical protein PROFUN_02611 [Planoprotostelium fungivorum]|uniref:Uncharacterized protein n=1 Tax=Planoprotostelium fungivorum TaxID=1890364 RepID=A0A2P6NV81_9EUKA|nr:hypothetical protein PROFUN_02611 [Planoprotostelium fungivorum]
MRVVGVEAERCGREGRVKRSGLLAREASCELYKYRHLLMLYAFSVFIRKRSKSKTQHHGEMQDRLKERSTKDNGRQLKVARPFSFTAGMTPQEKMKVLFGGHAASQQLSATTREE